MDRKPFVSIRKWIKWGDKPQFENTDTLVLTSREKHFVDIRIFTSPDGSLPNDPSDAALIQRLEWGFAGTSISSPVPQASPRTGPISHAVWLHWVDSKVRLGDEVQDEGDMYPVQGTAEVLEKGTMVNPATGEVEDYQELWEDLEIGKVGGEEEFVSWVLRTDGSVAEARGVVVRIGGWIQGVVRRGEVICVGRWEVGGNGEWRKTVAIGDLDISGLVKGSGKLEVNDELVGKDGLSWVCIESYSWR